MAVETKDGLIWWLDEKKKISENELRPQWEKVRSVACQLVEGEGVPLGDEMNSRVVAISLSEFDSSHEPVVNYLMLMLNIEDTQVSDYQVRLHQYFSIHSPTFSLEIERLHHAGEIVVPLFDLTIDDKGPFSSRVESDYKELDEKINTEVMANVRTELGERFLSALSYSISAGAKVLSPK